MSPGRARSTSTNRPPTPSSPLTSDTATTNQQSHSHSHFHDHPPPPEPHRKYKRVRPSLKRNEACKSCRRRKLKCDAQRPCGACERQFRFLKRAQPDPRQESRGIQCHYGASDDEDDQIQAAHVGGSGGMQMARGIQQRSRTELPTLHPVPENVGALSERVALLEATVAGLLDTIKVQASNGQPIVNIDGPNAFIDNTLHISTTAAQLSTFSSDPAPSQAPIGGDHMPPQATNEQSAMQLYLDTPWLEDTFQVRSVELPTSLLQGGGTGPATHRDSVTTISGITLASETNEMDEGLRAVIWPGWPKELPSPALLHHLVSTFFSSVPSLPRLFHRGSFLRRIDLPPSHVDFPHPSLLHAICALAARFSAAVKVQTVREELDARSRGIDDLFDSFPVIYPHFDPDNDPSTVTDFAERNARYAMSEMRIEKARGRQLFEICQAQVVLHGYYQQGGQWHNNWLMAGQSSRWALFLGLFRNELDNKGPFYGGRRPVLPASREDWDREERRRLMYQIMINDIVTSSGGNWPVALNVDELTANLPASTAEFERGHHIKENPQNVKAKDFYTFHPVKDSFVSHIKAVALLGQVSELRRRLRVLDDDEAAQFTKSRSFQHAVTAYHGLVASIPAEFRDPLRPLDGNSTRLDADLISAHIVAHAAAIMLAEPFADVENHDCPHAHLILNASRAIAQPVHHLINRNIDLSCCIVPISSLWFFMSARTLGLFYHQALLSDNVGNALSFLLDIEAIKTILGRLAHKSAIAELRRHLIETMMQRILAELGTSSNANNGLETILGSTVTTTPPSNYDFGHASPILPTGRTPKAWTFHPENLVWNSGDTPPGWTFRDILDQQRCYVGFKHHGVHGAIGLCE